MEKHSSFLIYGLLYVLILAGCTEQIVAPPKGSKQVVPFETLRVPGQAIAEQIFQYRQARPGTYPLLLGQDRDLQFLLDNQAFDSRAYAEILEDGLALDLDKWLSDSQLKPGRHVDFTVINPNPAADPAFQLALTPMGEPSFRVLVGFLPVQKSWMVPAYLKLGNWNLSPPPEVHVALCKKWSDQFGAVLICASADILEFEVANPPQTLEAAKKLALEQYFYCPDIVDQGLGTVGQLAVERVGAKHWFFWWD